MLNTKSRKKGIKNRQQTRQYKSGILRSCFWLMISYYYYYYYHRRHRHHHWHCTKSAIILRDSPLKHLVLCNRSFGDERGGRTHHLIGSEGAFPSCFIARKGYLTNWKEWGQHSNNEIIQEISERLDTLDPRVVVL